jgi:hypothetical protein
MSALTNSRLAPVDVAADLEAAFANPHWRRQVQWPVSLHESNGISRRQARAAIRWAVSQDDAILRDTSLLALPFILAYSRAIVLAALAASRAAQGGTRLSAAAPEFVYLLSGKGRIEGRADTPLAPVDVRFVLSRRIARMLTWTRLGLMPRAVLRPDAVAVSHNALLRATAAAEDKAVSFHHAELLLDRARRKSGAAARAPDCAPALSQVILEGVQLQEPYCRRASDLIEALVTAQLGKAWLDISALRSADLPREIWSGSGGLYASRAVGLEVLRRGGRVIRFDHGTPREFVTCPELTALLELAVSSEFVMATEAAAEVCRAAVDPALLAPLRPATVRGAEGDPSFACIPVRRDPTETKKKLRVVYAPSQLLGFRQLLPALPPDAIYLDWQMRVAETLKALDVEFICQPHPEGLFKGRPHPIANVAPTIRGNFVSQLDSADVFVFDCPTTTALWEATCTGARIVYLDIGAGTMTPAIARAFAERAAVIPAGPDLDNRPLLNADALRAAVFDSKLTPDPAAFRLLLAGV